MADVMPNYYVEQQKVRSHIADLEHRIVRYKLDVMEASEKKRSAVLNIKQTLKAIADFESKLKGLEKEHGKVEVDWDSLLKEVDDG